MCILTVAAQNTAAIHAAARPLKDVACHILHTIGRRPTRFTLLVRAPQHWQVDTDWWHPDGGVHREYWAVTTSGGLLCVVYKELGGEGGWLLAKMYD
ncbi:MAG: hypothetical protein U0X20_28225 [Caldilineaceae bacterium]